MSVPKAVPKNQVCSECGLDWARHPKKATTDDCIKLLKADLQNAEWRASFKPQPIWYERPYPWPRPIHWEVGTVKMPERPWGFYPKSTIEKTITINNALPSGVEKTTMVKY